MSSRKLVVVVLVIGLICVKLISCFHNRALRDKLVFKDDPQTVADSLIQMNLLLPKLPKHPNGTTVTNYNVQDGLLFVNGFEIKVGWSVLDSSFTKEERDRFSNLANYLATNYVTGCGRFGERNGWFYDYRIEKEGKTFVGVRHIVVGSSETDGFPSYKKQFIDSSHGLYLFRLHDLNN